MYQKYQYNVFQVFAVCKIYIKVLCTNSSSLGFNSWAVKWSLYCNIFIIIVVRNSYHAMEWNDSTIERLLHSRDLILIGMWVDRHRRETNKEREKKKWIRREMGLNCWLWEDIIFQPFSFHSLSSDGGFIQGDFDDGEVIWFSWRENPNVMNEKHILGWIFWARNPWWSDWGRERKFLDWGREEWEKERSSFFSWITFQFDSSSSVSFLPLSLSSTHSSFLLPDHHSFSFLSIKERCSSSPPLAQSSNSSDARTSLHVRL